MPVQVVGRGSRPGRHDYQFRKFLKVLFLHHCLRSYAHVHARVFAYARAARA